MKTISIVLKRELLKFKNEKGKLLNSLLSPILMILLFSYIYKNESSVEGFSASVQTVISGVLGIIVFNSSLQNACDFAMDKESGFMKEFLIAPIKRSNIILGRIFSDQIKSILEVLIIIVFSLIMGGKYTIFSVMLISVGILFTSLLGSSIGVLLACKTKNQMSLRLSITFLTVPLMFLSGSYLPLDMLPKWLKYVTYFNPASYIVSFFKYAGLSGTGLSIAQLQEQCAILPYINPFICLLFIAILGMLIFGLSIALFDLLLMKSSDK